VSFLLNRRAKPAPEPIVISAARPALQFRPALARRSGGIYRRSLKRALDLCLITVAAPIVVPVIGVLALLVAAQGGKPFYVQDRVGLEGRVFRMWKLRSMVPGADARLQDHLDADPAAREEWDLAQKLRCDPRITRLGLALRRYSLDELPQLWNVVLGDMSLVGPRPMMPCQQDIYPGLAYYRLQPGITGTWQVSERNDSSFAERARYDREYDRDLSLVTDLSILVQTVGVVARATGR
jgi:exopolysaccharide production protein ExoY